MRESIRKAIEAIGSRGPGVGLTGAGISAESGISTYRDPGALYDQYDQGSQGGMLGVLANNPDKAPEILGRFFGSLQQARPNPGHLGMAELEAMGVLKSVVTQNVDGLHRLAGSTTVRELHGSMYRVRCGSCGKKRSLERTELYELGERIVRATRESSLQEVGGAFPTCGCGGRTRFDFVGFGESVQDLDLAVQDVDSCGWMLIVGTSGVVYPAASLPPQAKRNGAYLIEVNPRESDLTSTCDLFVPGTGGEILPELVSALKESRSDG
ncbi:MAG: NAD-dependent protein deacylase [Proteobacteria bacterium]|nr:NAD-dependent protein deacylase [Pseudomonadota bacterium]